MRRNRLCLLLVLFVLSQLLLCGLFFRNDLEWEYYLALSKPYLVAPTSDKAPEATEYMQQAVKVSERFEPLDGRHSMSLYLLGLIHFRENRFKEAEAVFVQALDLQKRLVGEEDLLVGMLHAQLAAICQRSGRTEQAGVHAEAAVLALKRQALPDFQPRIQAEVAWGRYLSSQDRSKEAVERYLIALEALEQGDELSLGEQMWKKQVLGLLKLERMRKRPTQPSKVLRNLRQGQNSQPRSAPSPHASPSPSAPE